MNKKLNMTGEEYRHRVRQQAKNRTIRFREEQKKRGYKNLTIYLSEPFRAELEKLSDEQGLNRQAAMDHIFDVYQKNIDSVTSNAITKTEETPENAVNIGIENKEAKFNTDFQLVDIKAITPVRDIKDSELDAVDQWVRSILQFESLVTPLVLKETGVEKYTVIEGHIRFFAAVKARELDPRKFEMIGAIVISDVTSNGAITDAKSVEKPVNPKPLETESKKPAKINEQKTVEEPVQVELVEPAKHIQEPEQNNEPQGTDVENVAPESKPIQKVQEDQKDLFDKLEPDIKTTGKHDRKAILTFMNKSRESKTQKSWPIIADELNKKGYCTARSEQWTKANAQIFYSRNKEKA